MVSIVKQLYVDPVTKTKAEIVCMEPGDIIITYVEVNKLKEAIRNGDGIQYIKTLKSKKTPTKNVTLTGKELVFFVGTFNDIEAKLMDGKNPFVLTMLDAWVAMNNGYFKNQ